MIWFWGYVIVGIVALVLSAFCAEDDAPSTLLAILLSGLFWPIFYAIVIGLTLRTALRSRRRFR